LTSEQRSEAPAPPNPKGGASFGRELLLLVGQKTKRPIADILVFFLIALKGKCHAEDHCSR
jgi:hypothetical protein